MEITFKDEKLAKLVNDDRRMFNELGKMGENGQLQQVCSSCI